MHKSFYFSVFAILLLVHFGCRNSIKPDTNCRVQELVKDLEKKAIACDASLPDSAERYMLKGIEVSEAAGYEEGKLKMHSLLAEFYQYRIIDHRLAYFHMNEAINCFLRNPDYRITDPYLFIDLGNIQLTYGLIHEAQENYRNSYRSAQNTDNQHAMVLALHNLGLSWQQASNYDSAMYYYQKADSRINMASLAYSQNLQLKMKLRALHGKLHGLPFQLQNVQAAVEGFIAQKGGQSKIQAAETNFLHGVLAEAVGVLADFGGDLDKLKWLELSLSHAQKSQQPLLLLERQLALGNYLMIQGNLPKALAVKDSLMKRVHLLRNPQPLQKIYAYCTNLAEKLGDNKAMREAKINLEKYSDSVQRQNTDLEHLKAKLVISSVNANIAVENMKLVVSSGQKVIERQNAVIQFLLLVLGIIGLTVVAIWFYRRRFKSANRKFEARTIRLVQKTVDESFANGKELRARPGIECLTGKLEALNQTQRPYLNPDLTLDELAAMLGTNHTYLSAFINQHYGVNFNEYLNGLRVDYACALLLSKDPRLSNDQIMECSGFHSRSTFYAAFKKHMGVTPAAFLKMEHEVKKTAL